MGRGFGAVFTGEPVDSDWSVELGGEDPVLEVPWAAPDGHRGYVDLRAQPERLEELEEARRFPELGEALRQINGARGIVQSVKCDAWESTEMEEAEKIFGASHKIGSYCDVIFREEAARVSFEQHEGFARKVCALLRQVPEIPASAEFIVRRCLFHQGAEQREGCCITAYVFGYGKDGEAARRQWEIALKLAGNAMLQAGYDGVERPEASKAPVE